MHWAARIFIDVEVDVDRKTSKITSHLHTKLGGVTAPGKMSWGEFGAEVVRNTGLSSVLLGSWLGLGGFAGLENKKADAGIMLTAEAVEASKVPGAAATTDNGGLLIGVRTQLSDGTSIVVSGTAYNGLDGLGKIYIPAHVRYDRSSLNPIFTGIAGPNLNNPTATYNVIGSQVAPGYAGTGSLGTALDLEVLYLDRAILTSSGTPLGLLTIPLAPLASGETVTTAGFGDSGVWRGQYQSQDLFARAWTSTIDQSSTLLGANPDDYTLNRLDRSEPTSGRAANFDSGSPVFTTLSGDYILRGMTTQGDIPIFGQRAQMLDFAGERFQSFHQAFGNSMTAVPEPSSLISVALAALAGLYSWCRTRQLRNK